MHAQSHQSDPRILGRRTLQGDHRYLAQALRPGFSVLDVGCGTGAITAGIARAVGERGWVVGVDRDAALLNTARREHCSIPNLQFQPGDATTLSFHGTFDIVTAARTLQWVSEPGGAVLRMRDAARPSGLLVILDYNHAANKWEPDPPVAFQDFYRAFLAWREAHRWDNEMADHLPALFQSAGLVDVQSHVQDEVARRGETEFDERSVVWSHVMENLGGEIVKAAFLEKSRLTEASDCYQAWTRTELVKQTLAMRAVTGRVA